MLTVSTRSGARLSEPEQPGVKTSKQETFLAGTPIVVNPMADVCAELARKLFGEGNVWYRRRDICSDAAAELQEILASERVYS